MTTTAGGGPPTGREWEALTGAIESLARTVRGDPNEGHGGLMGRLRRIERVVAFLAGAVAVTAIERAPALIAWLASIF